MQEAGYGQANLVEDIVSRLSAQLQYQANLVEEETPPPPLTIMEAAIVMVDVPLQPALVLDSFLLLFQLLLTSTVGLMFAAITMELLATTKHPVTRTLLLS